MTSWKYTVNNVKSTAFTPVPRTSTLGSSHGLIHVKGQPGTKATPSPAPQALRPPCPGEIRNSMASPDVFFPCLYQVNMDGGTEPYKVVNRRSTHEVPVPARRAYVLPIPLARPARMGGQYAMRWPSAPQNYTPGSGAV
jgi:hypothetical protein